MTNDERLAKAQAMEYHQRRIVIGVCCAILVLAACLGSVLAVHAGSRSANNSGGSSPATAAGSSQSSALDSSSLSLSSSSDTSTQDDSGSAVSSIDSQDSSSSQSTSASESASAETSSQESSSQASSEASSDTASSTEAASASSSQESSASLPEGYEIRTMTQEDMGTGKLILVNKDHAYTFPEVTLTYLVDQDSPTYYFSSFQTQMEEEACANYNLFLNDYYYATGDGNLLVLNGYRTQEEAQALYDEDVAANGQEHADRYIMQAGYSEHHSGLASDLGYITTEDFISAEDTANYQWLVDHAHEYGFILRYPEGKESVTGIAYESWHWRYVGIAAATQMYEQQMCLEEWEEYIKSYSVSDPLIQTLGSSQIIRYYTEGLQVPVPATEAYEISGNNVDGFIVTITRDISSQEESAAAQ